MSFAFNLSAGSSDLLDFGDLDVGTATSSSRASGAVKTQKVKHDDFSGSCDGDDRKKRHRDSDGYSDALDDLLMRGRSNPSTKKRKERKSIAVRASDIQKSRDVWYGIFGQDEAKRLTVENAFPSDLGAVVSPQREVARCRILRRIHAALEEACGDHLDGRTMQSLQLHTKATLRNGDAVFERWLLRAMGESGALAALPMPSGESRQAREADEDLASDLASAGASNQQASSVIEAFRHQVDDLLTSFHSLYDALPDFKVVARQAFSGSAKKKSKKRVRASPPKEGTVTLTFRNAKLQINEAHYAKLRAMYDLVGYDSDASCLSTFHARLFCLLQRYEAIGGSGFQAALNSHVFDVLKDRLDVSFECFASPLNCRYEQFCSAFPDTDAPFGSFGSFLILVHQEDRLKPIHLLWQTLSDEWPSGSTICCLLQTTRCRLSSSFLTGAKDQGRDPSDCAKAHFSSSSSSSKIVSMSTARGRSTSEKSVSAKLRATLPFTFSKIAKGRKSIV